MKRDITILGAGLVGSLLSIILRKRGYNVTIYERRPDMRTSSIAAGRSINLAMSTRGWKALELAGLRAEIEKIAIAMPGRFLHQPNGAGTFQPYGKNGEAIYSVSRGELNRRLMTLAEEEGVRICFNQRVSRVDTAKNTLYFEQAEGSTPEPVVADLLFGADGAFSALRTAYSYQDRVSSSMQYLEHGYKELTIPPVDGKAQMDMHALHIWPRKNFMLIALPNTDGTFTCTLFLPFSGSANSFEALQTEADVTQFFSTHFPDTLPLMPTLLEDFFSNPTASLITTHISSWNIGDKSALIGDAAHAIVPFYGQGMNAGFEDCSILAALIDKHDGDWAGILTAYNEARKPSGDAVARLALINFVEMRDKVADPKFLERKKIEQWLGINYPQQFNSVYEMVSFSHIPYQTALQCIEAQDTLLAKLMEGNDNIPERAATEPHIKLQVDDWVSKYHQSVQELDFGR